MNESTNNSVWVVCQIGAREHYSIARGLHGCGMLAQLMTDLWVRPSPLFESLSLGPLRQLKGRFHSDLGDVSPCAPTFRAVAREAGARIRGSGGWENTIRRNRWFGDYCSEMLKSLARASETPLTVFSYSYAALPIFRVARELGLRTVLGQIDAGIGHQRRVADAYAKQPVWGKPNLPPDQYWADWQEECRLASRIIVNSQYSANELERAGMADAPKLEIIPLAYQGNVSSHVDREYHTFDETHPMRVLMIGRATLEKGMAILAEAARMLSHLNIVFDIVGDSHSVPATLRDAENLKFHGHVARSDVHVFYKNASVLAFPTLSDGFGLTQLEAQSHGLPIIASANCGDVVQSGRNGHRLQDNTAEELAVALKQCYNNPQLLQMWSANSRCTDEFTLQAVTQRLVNAA